MTEALDAANFGSFGVSRRTAYIQLVALRIWSGPATIAQLAGNTSLARQLASYGAVRYSKVRPTLVVAESAEYWGAATVAPLCNNDASLHLPNLGAKHSVSPV